MIHEYKHTTYRRYENLKKEVQKILVVLSIALAIAMFPSNYGNAEAGENLSFSFGENEVHIDGEKTIKVSNDIEVSSLSILENKQEIFQQELSYIQVTDFDLIVQGETSYGVITYRHDGSASAIYFDVVKFDKQGAKLIYTSEEFVQGLLEVSDNKITVEYPEYEADDTMTEPSSFATQNFIVEDTSVAAAEAQIEAIEKVATISSQSNGENPSYTEINRLLTEKALANGIAPEILKAIAYQETGWHQYWDPAVPKSIKDNCTVNDGKRLKWDGTNAKLGYDCIGVGIMQISNHMYMKEGPEKDAYIQRLKDDIEFNIDEGIDILLDKWRYKDAVERDTGLPLIPTVNDGDPMVIENWYFAIMAYNGMLERNNPHTNAYKAYQESVIERMRNFSKVDITPFPTQILEPYHKSNGQLRFDAAQYDTAGPVHHSSQSLIAGDTVYVNTRALNMRSGPGTNHGIVTGLSKGTKLTITGNYRGNNSRTSQFVWMPVRTSSGQTGWVSSSYLSWDGYVDAYRLEGVNRYATGAAVSNHGWHWEQSEYVVIGRGDLPIDALTGSVLAAGVDSPLLLTRSDYLLPEVELEIKRLAPKYVYILGSEQAVSKDIEDHLKKITADFRVERIEGSNRYETAKNVADVVASRHNVKEIFVTTGNENSSDALAIAPVAGEKNAPILLTNATKLSKPVKDYIQEQGINKVTIIGGKVAVSQNVENELKSLASTVERVEGKDRFVTNINIIEKYYDVSMLSNVFVSQGKDTADALAAAPFASKKGSPMLLTMPEYVPTAVNNFLKNKVKTSPDLYFYGGDKALTKNVRNQLINLVK